MDASTKEIEESKALKVFISYSRAQVHFADELELALKDKGFDVLIDRHGIAKGEDFQSRLHEMILACDTVVFILSDESAASDVCAWEVETARTLSKRMLVVTLGDLTPGVQSPEALAGIDWIHCWRNPAVPGSSQTKGFLELDIALRTDLGWLRQRTKLQEQAVEWERRSKGDPHHGRQSSLLLRGNILEEALDWSRNKPVSEIVPARVENFLVASEANETRLKAEADANLAEREQALHRARKASGRVRAVGLIGAAVAGVFLLLAIGAGWWGKQNYDRSVELAEQAATSERTSSFRIASVAKDFFKYEQGDHTASLLMALQADPSASRTSLRHQFDGKLGYAFARARLMAGQANNRRIRMFEGHQDAVTSVAVTSDGRLVTGSRDGTARLWDMETGEELNAFTGHQDVITSVAVTPDGRLVTGSDDTTARLWDLDTGEELRIFTGHQNAISSVAVTSDGRLVTGSGDGTARLWDMETGKEVRVLSNIQRLSSFVAVGPDGERISKSRKETARLRANMVSSVAVAPGGQLITGSRDGSMRVWDMETGEEISVLAGHELPITSVAVTPDGRLITGSWDNTALLWDTQTGEEIRVLAAHRGEVHSIAVTPDGRLVTGSFDGTARLWDIESGEEIRAFTGHGSEVTSVAVTPDGRLITGSSNGTARLWNMQTGEEIRTFTGHEGVVWSVAVTPDGHLATGSRDGTARLWNLETGEEIRTYTGHRGEIYSVAVAPNGRLVTGGGFFISDDNTARLWDIETGEEIRVFAGHKGEVSSVVVTSDGHLLTGSNDKTARLWDIESGEEIRAFIGHHGRVNSIEVTPDGQLVTVSSDGTARLWDMKTGEELRVFSCHDSSVVSLALTGDGHLVTGADDGKARLWKLPDIVLEADPKKQVEMACTQLWTSNAKLAFTAADASTYPVLRGEPRVDPDDPNSDFVSPCKGFLPDEAFAETN